MSTQQYSQMPNSYYGLEHYPYQQYMSGSQPQLGQTQAQPQAQSQPLTQQLLQAQSTQYQQPYGQYYMMNNQPVQPGQHPLSTQQAPQQSQYQLYQQPQGTQQPQVPQTLQQGDYAPYPGYGMSLTLAGAPYGQYASYQQNAQSVLSGAASSAAGAANTTSAPLSRMYAQPNLTGTQQTPPVPASLGAGASSLTNASAPATNATGNPSVPPISSKGSETSDTLGAATNSSLGQYQPSGIRPRVTTTMWEDEKTLCYQVDANNVSVVRRADNNMINGTKLLNVAQMTRGRRDGILKLEKVRHVVKIGSMHLKGVWIPFERALAMAQREGIVDMLYPLFVRDIKRVIQTGVTPAALGSAVSAAKVPIATNAAYGSNGTSLSNPSMSYYQQYPLQYPPAASASTSGLTAPQQQMAQQQLYGYLQPLYYNLLYAYNQPGNSGASTNYLGYLQAPLYLLYGSGYSGPQGQTQSKPYDSVLGPQSMPQLQSQAGSPGQKKEKEAEKK